MKTPSITKLVANSSSRSKRVLYALHEKRQVMSNFVVSLLPTCCCAWVVVITIINFEETFNYCVILFQPYFGSVLLNFVWTAEKKHYPKK